MDDKNLIQRHNSRIYDKFLMHWKYTKREKIGDKWKYYYDDDAARKNGSNPGKVPESYKPDRFEKWEETTLGSKKGYVDSKGIFYEGNYDTARQSKWEHEFRNAGVKAEVERAKAQYNNSVRKKVDDGMDAISDLGVLAISNGKNVIDTGKKAVANILDKISKKLRE